MKKGSDVFGLDVSMGLRVDWYGLHPARKRSNGGLGVLEDNPQLSKGIHYLGSGTATLHNGIIGRQFYNNLLCKVASVRAEEKPGAPAKRPGKPRK